MSCKSKRVMIGAVISIVLVSLYAFELPKLFSVVLYADDFHYWASGAFWAGYDWSGMMRHGFYYSYGYGFLLAPLFAFTKDGVVLFRLGIVLNYILLIAAYWLLVRIGSLVFDKVSRTKICAVSFLACVYPAWQIHLNSAMCEGVLYFLFIVMTFLLVEIEKKSDFKKAIVLGFLAVYIYMVHQRMLVATVAVTVAVTVLCIVRKIDFRCFLDYILTLLFTFGAHYVIKPAFQDYLYINYSTLDVDRRMEIGHVLSGIWLKVLLIYVVLSLILFLLHKTSVLYWLRKYWFIVLIAVAVACVCMIVLYLSAGNGGDILTNNEYAVVLEKIGRILTPEYFFPFFRKIMGHVFYLFTATGGLAVYVILCGVSDIIHMIKNKKYHSGGALAFFLVISAILILGLSSVYIDSQEGGRIDALIYGRYSEFMAPVLLIMGILRMENEGIRWKEWLSSIFMYVGVTYFVYEYYKQGEVCALFTDLRFLSVNTPAVYNEFADRANGVVPAFLVGMGLCAIVIIMGVYGRKSLQYILMALMGIIFINQGKDALEAYLLPQQELQNQGNEIAETILNDYGDYDVFFMKEEKDIYHSSGYFQVRMPKVHMLALRDEQAAEIGDHSIVICDMNDWESMSVLEDAGFRVLQQCETAVCYIRRGEYK